MHELERKAHDILIAFTNENAEILRMISGWGDGRCGHIAEVMCEHLGIEEQSKAQSSPKITERHKKWLYENQGYLCLSCDSPNDITVDHVQPISKGGDHNVGNMQILCRSCNSRKGVKNTDYRNKKASERVK